jgi:hypothetical protein
MPMPAHTTEAIKKYLNCLFILSFVSFINSNTVPGRFYKEFSSDSNYKEDSFAQIVELCQQ